MLLKLPPALILIFEGVFKIGYCRPIRDYTSQSMCSGATQQWPGADIFPLMLNVNKALNKSTQQAVFVNAGVSRWEILAVLAAKISLLVSSTWLCCLLGSWHLHCFEPIIIQPLKLGRTTSRKGDCGGELVLRALRFFTTNGDQVHIPSLGAPVQMNCLASARTLCWMRTTRPVTQHGFLARWHANLQHCL